MSDATPRIALVGAGSRGEPLLRALADVGALAAVCDLDPDVRARFPDVRTTDDYLALLADPAIDAVVLATPTGSHDGMAQAALEAGKHVLVEGLLGVHADAAAELVALAERRGRVLQAGAGLRFDAALVAFRVAAATIGALRYVHAEALAPRRERRDDAAVFSFAPELVGLVLALAGERPEWIRTQAAGIRDGDVADVTFTGLGFPAGLRAHVHVSWMHPLRSLRVVATGDEGTVLLQDGLVTRYVGDEGAPVAVDAPDAARAACARFLEALERGRSDDARHDVAVLRVVEAAQRSLDEDRAVHPASKAPEKATERPGVRLHATVAVDGDVDIGEGTSIWHFSKLLGPCRIGKNCTFGQNVVVERHVTVGDNVKIQNNVSVYSGVILEDDVFCGPSMVFTNVGTPRSGFPRKGQYTTTLVKRGASIGANATVVCGHTLGRYCFVGAGAVVTRDVPDYALVYGNPARLRGWACFCGATLPFGTSPGESEAGVCPDCGRRYAREGHVVRELDAAG